MMAYCASGVIGSFLSILIVNRITNGRIDIIGLVLFLSLIIRSVVEIPFSKFVKNRSIRVKKIIVAVAFISRGVFTILLGYSTSVYQLIIFQIFASISEGLYFPLKWSIFAHLLDKGEEEYEYGIEDVITNIPSAIFALIIGLVSQYYGLPIIFVIFGIFYAISGIVFYFI